MANTQDYSALAQPLSGNAPDYSALSQPVNAPQSSAFQKMANAVKNYFPKPQLPLGMNVASGLMSGIVPANAKQMVADFPQIATQQQTGIPQKVASDVGSMIPSLTTGGESLLGQAVAGGALGAAQAPAGQKLLSGAENTLATLGLGKALPYLANILRPVKPVEVAKTIQDAHDVLKDQAENAFSEVSQDAASRGVNQVPIDNAITRKFKNYFPNTKQANALLKSARAGDYDSLRDVQSQLFQSGTKAKGSDLLTDRMKGDEMMELRDDINNSIENHLNNTGNPDLADKLNKARQDYYDLNKLYYSNPTIAKMVGSETREIPNNIMSVLSRNSVPINRLRDLHLAAGDWNAKEAAFPDIASAINAFNAKKKITPYIGGLGLGAGSEFLLHHYLMPQKNIFQPTNS